MYQIQNSHGAPQCGFEIIRVATFDEVENYMAEHEEDFEMGYAGFFEMRRENGRWIQA